MAAFTSTDVFVGSVGRGPGAAGSDWYTSVWIHNPGTAPATVTAYLLLRNQTNPTPATQTITVQPGETRRIDNVVETLFGQTNSFGAMRFTSVSKILVNARIYNKPGGAADNDSSGQNFDGIPSSFAVAAGQSTIVLGVHQTNPFDASQFRYNYGFVETAGGSGLARVAAFDSAGASVGTKDYSFGPYEARQFGIVDVVPSVNSTNLRLTVSVVSGTGRVIAFGSGIANHTNDPTTFDMSFRDELLAGPPVATSVTHDATLTGDGSTAAPLGVANLGVGASKINSTGGAVGNVLTATAGGGTAWQAAPAPFALPFAGTGAPATSAVFRVTNSSTSSGTSAIVGISSSAAWGVTGMTDVGIGVRGEATGFGSGVVARSENGDGLAALSVGGVGIESTAFSKESIHGRSSESHGVWGESNGNNGYGVLGINNAGNHAGLLGTLGYAGDFVGDVRVKGNLSKFGGSFTIDHPLDPEHKTLSHSFVESPDMKNVYDGVVVTDGGGAAIVDLPEWFEALNRDFRYQLTVIGRFAQAIIETEIEGNRFTIRTDHPNVKVSWQVTGIRRDPWAERHRIAVEQDKPAEEQGLYLAPEVYGQPREKDVFWARHPELIHK
jgi:hypothetical protein